MYGNGGQGGGYGGQQQPQGQWGGGYGGEGQGQEPWQGQGHAGGLYPPQPGAGGINGGGGSADPGTYPSHSSTGYSAPGQGGGGNWNQWAPSGVNEQMLHMGGNVAKDFISSNMARYQPGVWSFWQTVKYYFTVDNAYVLKKLKVLFCPIMNENWQRLRSQASYNPDMANSAMEREKKFAPPQLDVNAPDLYIPVMSFVTYVLLSGFLHGRAEEFTPEVLKEGMTSGLVTDLILVILLRFGLYLLGAPASFLELSCYSGYKYVALCVNLTLGILLGRTCYYIALVWTGCMGAYFMLKTMADYVPVGPNTRDVMIFAFAGIQLLAIWWLGSSLQFLP